MLLETGKVIGFDHDAVWVRTMRQSVCGSCQARMGCGQNLLNQLVGVSADIKVRLPQKDREIIEGDIIEIGIEEGAVVAASLLAYGAPLLGLIFGVVFADILAMSTLSLLLVAMLGLSSGILFARLLLSSHFHARFFEPIFIRKIFLNTQNVQRPIL